LGGKTYSLHLSRPAYPLLLFFPITELLHKQPKKNEDQLYNKLQKQYLDDLIMTQQLAKIKQNPETKRNTISWVL